MARRRRSMYQRQQQPMATRLQPSRRTGGTFDWITSTAATNAAGAPIVQTSWGGAINLTNDSIVFQSCLIQPAPASSTPSIGRLRVDEIRGRICVKGAITGTGDSYFAAVGIYVSELNNTTTLWNVRNLLTASDAARDDYLYLEGKSFLATNLATATPAVVEDICFELNLSQPVIIGGGQAVHVQVAVSSISQAATVSSFFRTRVGPVA